MSKFYIKLKVVLPEMWLKAKCEQFFSLAPSRLTYGISTSRNCLPITCDIFLLLIYILQVPWIAVSIPTRLFSRACDKIARYCVVQRTHKLLSSFSLRSLFYPPYQFLPSSSIMFLNFKISSLFHFPVKNCLFLSYYSIGFHCLILYVHMGQKILLQLLEK